MKKLLFLVFVLAVSATLELSAQMFIGGGINFNTHSSKRTIGSTTVTDGKSFNFYLSPKVGYFLHDNFAVGLGIEYGYSKGTSSVEDAEAVTKGHSWAISPFARYYFVETGNLSFFAEGSVSIGWYKSVYKAGSYSQDSPKNVDVMVNVMPAVAYNFSEKFSIEASLGGIGYSSTKSSYTKDNGDEDKSTDSGLNISFGLENLTFSAIYILKYN